VAAPFQGCTRQSTTHPQCVTNGTHAGTPVVCSSGGSLSGLSKQARQSWRGGSRGRAPCCPEAFWLCGMQYLERWLLRSAIPGQNLYRIAVRAVEKEAPLTGRKYQAAGTNSRGCRGDRWGGGPALWNRDRQRKAGTAANNCTDGANGVTGHGERSAQERSQCGNFRLRRGVGQPDGADLLPEDGGGGPPPKWRLGQWLPMFQGMPSSH